MHNMFYEQDPYLIQEYNHERVSQSCPRHGVETFGGDCWACEAECEEEHYQEEVVGTPWGDNPVILTEDQTMRLHRVYETTRKELFSVNMED